MLDPLTAFALMLLLWAMIIAHTLRKAKLEARAFSVGRSKSKEK